MQFKKHFIKNNLTLYYKANEEIISDNFQDYCGETAIWHNENGPACEYTGNNTVNNTVCKFWWLNGHPLHIRSDEEFKNYLKYIVFQ